VKQITSTRLAQVDALRGFALFGILLANLPYDPETAVSSAADHALKFLFHLLIDKKLITIFSILFGFGFFMQMQKAEREDRNFKRYFLVRMLLLFAIGCLHAYGLWFGDIIRTYALGGIFMLLVYHWPMKRLIWLSIFFNIVVTGVIFIGNATLGWQSYNYDPALAVELPVTADLGRYLYLNFRIDPWRNFLQDMPLAICFTFGNMLLGMILAKKGFFHDASSMKQFKRSMILAGFTIGLAGSYIFYMLQTGKMEMSPALIWLPFILIACMLMQSLGYISLFLWIFNKDAAQTLLRVYIPVGQMALTNYVMQSLLYLLVFFHCTGLVSLFGRSSLSMTYLIGLGFFAFQVWLSIQILKKFPQGPIETAWRNLTRRLTALRG
jgi:uncharacterized protein